MDNLLREELNKKARVIIRNSQFRSLRVEEKERVLRTLVNKGLDANDLTFLLKEYLAERQQNSKTKTDSSIEDIPVDVLGQMSLDLPIASVISLCRTDRNMKKICERDSFWQKRVTKDIPRALSAKKYFPDMSWRSIYRLYYMLPVLPDPEQLTTIKTLSFDSKQLTSIPPELGRLTSLQTLQLTNNLLTSLPPELVQLSSLRILNVYNNQLTIVPPELGQLSSLEYLNLSDNQLTSLSPELGQLSSLQQLHLNKNQLTSLPLELAQLSSLRYLDLSSNKLTSLPPELGQISTLEMLYLDNNPLMSLPPELGQLSSLQILNLENTRLTVDTIPAALRKHLPRYD